MWRLGEAQLKAGQIPDAIKTADSAVEAERPIASGTESDLEEHSVLVYLLVLDGRAHAANWEFDRAEELLREARERAELLLPSGEIMGALPWAKAEVALGAFYAGRHRMEEARTCYRQVSELWQHFPDSTDYLDRQKKMTLAMLDSLH